MKNQEETKKECEKSFDHRSVLIKHERIHTGERPYTCTADDCNQKFSQVSNLRRHVRTHTGYKPFVCRYCEKAFTSSSNLKQHENVHKTKKFRHKFVCFVKNCSKIYYYVCTLKKHMMNRHRDIYDTLRQDFSNSNFYNIYSILRNKKSEYQNTYDFLNVNSFCVSAESNDFLLNTEPKTISVEINQENNTNKPKLYENTGGIVNNNNPFNNVNIVVENTNYVGLFQPFNQLFPSSLIHQYLSNVRYNEMLGKIQLLIDLSKFISQ